MRRTAGASAIVGAGGQRGTPAGHDRVGVEQRHRQVGDVVAAQPEPLGQQSARGWRPSSWVTRTALGSPQVPEVKISMNRSSGSTSIVGDGVSGVCASSSAHSGASMLSTRHAEVRALEQVRRARRR